MLHVDRGVTLKVVTGSQLEVTECDVHERSRLGSGLAQTMVICRVQFSALL